MKSLEIVSRGRLQVSEVPAPRVAEGELLIEMKSCGVCGTDVEKVNGEGITPPVLGHEVVGTVAKVGKSVQGFSEGERVFAHHHAPCYQCNECRRGEFTLCSHFPRHNIRPGGFSEFFVVPAWNVERRAVLKLPSSLSFEEASFIEPLGCCLRGVEKLGVGDGSGAVVYGAGPVGLTLAALLRGKRVRTVVIGDLSEFRRRFATKAGFKDTYDPTREEERRRAFESFEGGRPELAVVATGNPAAFSSALKDVARGGKVLLFGAPAKSAVARMNLGDYFLSGVTIIPSYSTSEVETRKALRLLSTRKLSLSWLVTHRFQLEEAVEAFRVATEQVCIKALVNN